MSSSKIVQKLIAQKITPENFQPYGQVIFPREDGHDFNANEAQLNLQNGTPRLYIMRLRQKGCKFHIIARHIQCTQCLGAADGKDWFIAVAPPNQDSEQPNLEALTAFWIPGHCFIKLELGTWHAGPYFQHDFVDFYNLELADTNLVDRFTYNFIENNHLEFEIVETSYNSAL